MAVAIWLGGFLLLWTPGFLILRSLGVMRREDRIVRLAIEIALGLSVWPISTLAGVALALLSAAACRRFVLREPKSGSKLPHSTALRAPIVLLIAASVVSRLIHIRNLAFPPWIDSVHHGMIIRLFIDGGQIPANYHWGYHATAAILAKLLRFTRAEDIPTLMLHYGQLLNVLSAVTIYAAARVATRSRMAGLFAATLAMFASWYPAYYLSWGRYTHLAGTLILPPLLIVLWRIAQGRRQWGFVVLAAILGAGLVLVHVRIAFFAVVFALMLVPLAYKRHRLLRLAVAGLLASIIVAPWLVRVVRNEYVQAFVRPGVAAADDYFRAVPYALLSSNRNLLSIASGGLSGVTGILDMPPGGRILSAMWIAALIWAATRKGARRFNPWRALVFIVGYVLVVGVLLTWPPLTRFASPASAVMTLFLPLSIIGGWLAAWFLCRVQPRVAFAAMAAIIAIGFWRYFDVVNPQTVFADERDRRALAWIQKNTPPNALFAIDGRPWTVKPAWAGIDGGYWINVATDRKTILPPAIYAWSLPPEEVARINDAVAKWSFQSDPGPATHIYVGWHLDETRRAALLRNPHARVVYRDDAVAVLERIRQPAVDVSPVKPERRVDRIRGYAVVDLRR